MAIKVKFDENFNNPKVKVLMLKGETGATGSIGTPLVASSVSEMTDTTRNYINTTDGHWYYYNGSTWVDGGAYQATEDSDTVNILLRNEKSNIKNLYQQVNFNLNAFDGAYSHQFYSAQTGEPASINQKYLSGVKAIEVTGGSSFNYEIEQNSSNNITAIFWLFYNNDTFISSSYQSSLKNTINIPSTANKMRFEIAFTNNIDINDATNIIIHTTNEEDVRTKFNNLNKITQITNELNNSQKFIGISQSVTKLAKSMKPNGDLVDLSNYGLQSYHAIVDVNEYEYYNIKSSGSIYYPPFMFFDSNNNFITDYYSISGDTRTGNINIDYNVQVPQNATKIVINTFYNYIELSSLVLKNVGLSVMPKQKYIAFGDSVCRGNHPDATKSLYAWPEMFGQIHNLETQNKANGGQGFLNTTYYNKTALQTIQETDISDTNLISISFGINDAGASFTIGDVNDTGTTSICGMLYNCINYILTTNPKCQIIVTGTTKQNGVYSTRLKEINDKMELVCQKYGIAFVNMYEQPINQFNGTTGGTLTSDGTHFNDDGYLLLAQYMCAKLSSLYGLI